MAYAASDARREMLATVASATNRLGVALAALGEAYEQLDEGTADRLEEELFRPVQVAYGRARRTHTEFAARHGMPRRNFAPGAPGAPSGGARGFVERAVDAITGADEELAALQDSMRPVEVGDAPLRAGLAEVRTIIANLPARANGILRVLGR
jgi:hypothetical protein